MYDLKDSRWLKNVRRPGDRKQPRVVLTFDDGPSHLLKPILDVLQEENVPAVFFWQTRLVYKQRLWQRALQEGHYLGSHTHSHKNLTKLTRDEQYKQIKTSVDQLRDVTGRDVCFFRPPFGQYNETTMQLLNDLHLTPVMWEISGLDWEHKQDPARIVKNVTEHMRDGSIILLHELEQTLSILPRLIDEVRTKGFAFTNLNRKASP
ncbi:polysaccharide deacetylase family protein [Bacillus piscicola]|uniref:polysaccharide deacetylase family protein n=1 Tax=Bacillus piscicola TaxID=1632684 RepID=UPI001F091F2E|nr:polysaccharide deacetylase family protein [Bacillus piscicola]